MKKASCFILAFLHLTAGSLKTMVGDLTFKSEGRWEALRTRSACIVHNEFGPRIKKALKCLFYSYPYGMSMATMTTGL
jgi:hypothetical protein